MRILLMNFIFLSGCFNCVSKKNLAQENDISCAKITRNVPVFDFKDSIARIISYDTLETRIYHYQNQELYQTYYRFTGFSFVDSIPTIHEYRCNFFVYEIGQTIGLFYDSTKKIYNKPVKVDSMLKKQRQYKLEVLDLYDQMILTHLRTVKNEKTNDMEDWYSSKGRQDSTMTGSVILSFTNKNRFTNVEYSFSKELDSLKRMKLYKIVTVTDARFIGPPNNIYMDRAESFYLLENIPVDNRKEVMKYFNAEYEFRTKK